MHVLTGLSLGVRSLPLPLWVTLPDGKKGDLEEGRNFFWHCIEKVWSLVRTVFLHAAQPTVRQLWSGYVTFFCLCVQLSPSFAFFLMAGGNTLLLNRTGRVIFNCPEKKVRTSENRDAIYEVKKRPFLTISLFARIAVYVSQWQP